MILRNFNIYVSSAANLVHVEKALSEKLRIWFRLFFLLVKMNDKGNSKTSIFSLFINLIKCCYRGTDTPAHPNMAVFVHPTSTCTKKKGGLKVFISIFASFSRIIALKIRQKGFNVTSFKNFLNMFAFLYFKANLWISLFNKYSFINITVAISKKKTRLSNIVCYLLPTTDTLT